MYDLTPVFRMMMVSRLRLPCWRMDIYNCVTYNISIIIYYYYSVSCFLSCIFDLCTQYACNAGELHVFAQ